MPVRSSVCTYSPSSAANSKYVSSTLPASSNTIGHYKPLSSLSSGSPTSATKSSLSSAAYKPAAGSTLGRKLHGYSSGVSTHLLLDDYGSSSSSSSSSSTTSTGSSASSSGLGSVSSRFGGLTGSSAASSYTPSSHYAPSSASSLSSRSSTSSTLSAGSGHSASLGHYRPLSSAHNSFTGSSRYSSPASVASSSAAYSRLPSAVSAAAGDYHHHPHHHYQPASSVSRRLSYVDGAGSRLGLLSSSALASASSAAVAAAPEPLPSGVPRGLINLGNTCYMNAVFQSLYSVDSFRNLILGSAHGKTLTSELSELFNRMKGAQTAVSPASFKSAFARYQAKFAGLGQQDAQEFLRYLIDGIHEECNHASRRPRRVHAPKAPRSADEAWCQYTDIVDDSPLVNILVGQMCSTIVCSVCSGKSSCWDPFWDLSLPLTRGRHSCRLADILADFTAKETLDSDERPVCATCQKATKSTKQMSLCRLPQLLILHLKKFSNDGYKLTSPELRIDPELTFNDTTAYQLRACISHHGHSASSGHYTSHCKYSSRWFHFNDDRVKDVTSSFDSSKLNDAYVLFYTRSGSLKLDQSRL